MYTLNALYFPRNGGWMKKKKKKKFHSDLVSETRLDSTSVLGKNRNNLVQIICSAQNYSEWSTAPHAHHKWFFPACMMVNIWYI